MSFRSILHIGFTLLSTVVMSLVTKGSLTCGYGPSQSEHKPFTIISTSYLREIEARRSSVSHQDHLAGMRNSQGQVHAAL